MTTSAPRLYINSHTSRSDGVGPLSPELSNGWCITAIVHRVGVCCIVVRTNAYCAEVLPIGTLVLSIMIVHSAALKL